MPNEELLNFIRRRFPNEELWATSNCYWFAQLLNHWCSLKDRYAIRYLVYDVVYEHFYLYYNGWYYDWYGAHESVPNGGYDVRWSNFEQYDDLQYDRVIEDYIL